MPNYIITTNRNKIELPNANLKKLAAVLKKVRTTRGEVVQELTVHTGPW